MIAFLKYSAIAVSIFLIALGLRYIPYIAPVREFSPLSPEAFDRLGEPPTKNFDDDLSAGAEVVSLPNRFFANRDQAGLSESPTKDLESAPGGTVTALPTPKILPPPEPPTVISPVSIPTTSEVNKVIERIVERVVVKEVPVYITQPAPAPAPAPVSSGGALASACSIQTFENAAGGSSHTLLYRCEGFDQCSIAKNGETFIDVSGKGYFNFPGSPPSNYKLLCDDRARVWSSAITPIASKPLFDQAAFRWFANDDVEIATNPLAGINELTRFHDTKNAPFRLRLAIVSARVPVARGDAWLKLQVAFSSPTVPLSLSTVNAGVLCNQIPDKEYKDLQLSDNVAFFNNPSLDDKQLMSPSAEDPFYGVAVPQTYQESNSFSNSNAPIPQDTPGIWDFALRIKSMDPKQLACFRAVRSDGLLLDGYDAWPAIYNN